MFITNGTITLSQAPRSDGTYRVNATVGLAVSATPGYQVVWGGVDRQTAPTLGTVYMVADRFVTLSITPPAPTPTISGITVSISPTSGPSGTRVTIKGEGFKAFTSVQELKIGDVDIRPIPVPASDAIGAFSAIVTLPQLNVGTQIVSAKVSDSVAATTFTVTAAVP